MFLFQNNMSDDKIMTQGSTNAKKKSHMHNNNGTQQSRKQNGSTRSSSTMRSRTAANNPEASNGKENLQTDEPTQCKTSESAMTLQTSTSADTVDTIRTEGKLPLNGHTRVALVDRDKRFIKQQSEASSSGVTAELNMEESMMTNESSLANKSFVTSISVGGQTDKSAGADSAASVKSNVSTAEIRVCISTTTSSVMYNTHNKMLNVLVDTV